MCTQKQPHDFSDDLYKKYGEVFGQYCSKTVRQGPGLPPAP